MDKWRFRRTEVTLEIEPPPEVSSAAAYALWDFLTTEIGDSKESLCFYRDLWKNISRDPDEAMAGISGNGTSQHIEGDNVVLESLYEQWDTVHIPRWQFERFLDDFADFLDEPNPRT